ncbi:MBL fold metallo-hydrolase [Rhodococcus rhodnii]|uniref:Hydrolase n=2 Tax=Rhodococcus rhodnii TaxID=38312 RepID=R7WIR4_9NOCA|nr:MBL fold metallo-hydrolase [Rhodococcus rhodnii]EOM75093.1 hydrolase [Rhodococcus rhodnii LMG 5362]TXG89325.1 MBL fold metallo-hydrolase [Rhodococcus rhodnii]
MTAEHPAYGTLRQVTPLASVVLQDNPGTMTLDGTNTWVLGEPGGDVVVVDPGEHDDEHLGRLLGQGRVVLTLVTHRHHDHTGGVDRFAELTGAPVRSTDPSFLRGGGRAFEPGEEIEAAGVVVTAIPTPGHTADSTSFRVRAANGPRADVVLTGDTILGRGTTVLDDTDGDLGDYLDSLATLAAHGPIPALPGHGPDLPDLEAIARDYRAHREQRLDQVRGALRTLGADASARAVTAHVYSDVDPGLLPVAERSVRVQLDYLRTHS